jgi:hypothetical protein
MVGANSALSVLQIKNALWATDLVRNMALTNNRPFTWTDLTRAIAPRFTAVCSDYAEALLQVLSEMNLQMPSRRLDVALNPNTYDAHTLVELFDTSTSAWMLLDPTFDLSVTRTSDGGWATAEDVQAATLSKRWNDVSYTFLGSAGDAYARAYYLDYPLLFVNVYHGDDVAVNGQGGAVLPYMEALALPISGPHRMFAIGCGTDGTATVRIDGVDQVVDCSGVDGLSHVFDANVIQATSQTSSSVTVYRPRRYVF